MSEISYSRNGGWVEEMTTTPTGENSPSVNHRWAPYRKLMLSLSDGQVANNGTDTETVTIEVVDGLEVARGTDPANATVLDYDGDCTVVVDGAETTKTLSGGSVSFDITTTKSAGETIEVVAQTLTDHPAESDSSTIEVVSA